MRFPLYTILLKLIRLNLKAKTNSFSDSDWKEMIELGAVYFSFCKRNSPCSLALQPKTDSGKPQAGSDQNGQHLAPEGTAGHVRMNTCISRLTDPYFTVWFTSPSYVHAVYMLYLLKAPFGIGVDLQAVHLCPKKANALSLQNNLGGEKYINHILYIYI